MIDFLPTRPATIGCRDAHNARPRAIDAPDSIEFRKRSDSLYRSYALDQIPIAGASAKASVSLFGDAIT
jgi:hypothetical protein